MAPGIVLFDLDGTVSDSAPGILAALRHAFAAHDLPWLDADGERHILGPPFYESLPPLIGDVPLMSVIDSYREHYSADGSGSMYDTVVFDGVADVLADLAAAGTRLAIATSKPEYYAVPIVEHLGVHVHFEVIGGDALDGSRQTKALVIEDVLRRLGNPAADEILMVGDRSHDVLGARAHGIETVAVTWGYAMPDELDQAAPKAIVDTAKDLHAILLA